MNLETTSLPKSVFIAGISSDIGRELAERFLANGSKVSGTYRKKTDAFGLYESEAVCRCDLLSREDIVSAAQCFANSGRPPWDLYISSIGTLEPIGMFFKVSAEMWFRSIELNCLRQLELLRALFPYRKKGMAHIVFFAGAGTNGGAPAYSAYSASKIFLIKMCELLHEENLDLNCFIIGPGIVRTKIHEQTIRAGECAGSNLQRIKNFLDSSDSGVSHDEIFECLCWGVSEGREVVGGRNISLVGDAWASRGSELAGALRASPDAFRLRRHNNDLLK